MMTAEEREVICEAMSYCLHHYPTLWTTGGRPERRVGDDGSIQWLVHVYLRYPTGHEGYLGDILHNGKNFVELTDRQVMLQRARAVEANPSLQREWDEYRAASLRSGKP